MFRPVIGKGVEKFEGWGRALTLVPNMSTKPTVIAEAYVPPPPHAKPADAEAFLASLPEIERQLHALAAEKLGSSYFMDRTHSYKAWKRNTAVK
jgi:hypothetical protein